MRTGVKRSILAKWSTLAVLLVVCLGGTQALPCDESMRRQHCLDCNADNYCIECTVGYFVAPSMASSSGGHCVRCSDKCLECTSERCTRCETGYISYPDKCIPCEYGCQSCEGFPNKCTSCIDYYKLDMEGECYFRYAILITLCTIVILSSLLALFYYCIGSLRNSTRQRGKSNKENGESILGDEFRQTPTLIVDVTQIGKQSDTSQDLSLVADSNDGIPQVNSPNDSMRHDFFDESQGKSLPGSYNSRSQTSIHLGKQKKQ